MSTHAFSPSSPFSNFFDPRGPNAFADDVTSPGTATAYVLVPKGPAVASHEVETDVDAVEVNVRWGEQVLAVSHLEKGKSFWIGEGHGVALPEGAFSAARVPVVDARGDEMIVLVPPNARGVVMRGAEAHSLGALLGQGSVAASSKVAGAYEIPLTGEMSITLEIGANENPVVFEIRTVRAGKTFPVALMASLATGATGILALSFFGHAAIVSSLAMFMPSLGADDADGIDREQLLYMQAMLNASAERELDPPKETAGPSDDAAGGGSTGAPHKGESGAAGKPTATATRGRMAFKGTDPDPAIARREELEFARTGGMIGLLNAGQARDPNAPSSPWSEDTYRGSDERSAMGQLFGATIDDVNGFGLGLTGTGEGGGGMANVVGLDHVNTVGGGGGGTGKWGIGPGDGDGIGHGRGPGRGHTAKAPIARPGTMTSNGRLPAEVIQRIVRQNFGRFRLCYEQGLRGNPSLTGRIATKFVIGRDGSVMQSQDAGSDMPNQSVVSCVVRSFQSLSFPQPEGGVATVVYPIVLTPGD